MGQTILTAALPLLPITVITILLPLRVELFRHQIILIAFKSSSWIPMASPVSCWLWRRGTTESLTMLGLPYLSTSQWTSERHMFQTFLIWIGRYYVMIVKSFMIIPWGFCIISVVKDTRYLQFVCGGTSFDLCCSQLNRWMSEVKNKDVGIFPNSPSYNTKFRICPERALYFAWSSFVFFSHYCSTSLTFIAIHFSRFLSVEIRKL